MIRKAVHSLWFSAALLAGCSSGNERADDVVTAAPNTQQQPIELSGNEIRALFNNMTLKREGGGWVWHALFLSDGTMRGRAEWPGGGASATGIWDVTDSGLFCRDWDNNWGGGGRGCFKLYRAGDDLLQIYQHGSAGRYRKSRLAILGGNPAGL